MPIRNEYISPRTISKILTANTKGVEARCLECSEGRCVLQFPEAFYKKYGGQIREVITTQTCHCGSHLWMITIPSRQNTLDEMIGDENDTPTN